jgi:chromate transporter
MEEFLRLWNLCLLTPGINLLALTVLLGKKMGGTSGIIASLAGMLLPSATITCLLAALFVQIEQAPAVQAVLRGVIPATGGIMLLVGLNFARPLIQRAHKAGIRAMLQSLGLVALSALVMIFLKLSVIVVVLGSLCLGALFFAPRPPLPPKLEQGKPL